MFAANFANSAQGVLLSNYIEYYDLIPSQQGLMGMFQSIGSILICLGLVFAAGRIKRSYILLFSAAVLFAAMLVIGFKPFFFLLLFMYLVIGLGYASASNVSSSLTSEMFKGSSSAMGMLHAVFGIGGLIAPIVLNSALDKMPWNYVCFLDAAIILIVLIVYIISLNAASETIGSLKEYGNHIKTENLRKFFTERKNILLLIATFGYMAFQNGINVWIVRFSQVELEAGSLSAVILSVFWVGNTLARLIVPRLKVKTEKMFSLGCLVSAFAFGTGILLKNPVVMIVCIAVCGITSGASIPQIYHMACVWNNMNSLLPTSVCGITLFVSTLVTSPITASLTSFGLNAGMISIFIYVLIAAIVMFPLVLKNRSSQC